MNLVLLPVRRCVLASVLVLGSIGPSSAHDVWLTLSGPSARRVIINYGHPDDRPPALADKVVDIIEITAGARRSLLNGLEAATENGFTVARTKPFADGGHTLLARATTMASGSEHGGLDRNATRRFVPGGTDSLWSGKFAKAITGPDAPWQEVLGHELEIVPLADPIKVKPGESLRVKVLFRAAAPGR